MKRFTLVLVLLASSFAVAGSPKTFSTEKGEVAKSETTSLELMKSEKTDDLDASVREQLIALEHSAKKAEAKVDAVSADGTSATTGPAAASEADIPVLTAKKKTDPKEDSLSQKIVISFVIVFAILGGGLLFLRRYIGNRREKTKHTQIKIVTQHFIGPKKSLAIVRVAGESILIGVTDHSINLLKQLHTLDEDMLEEEESVPQNFDRTLQTRSLAIDNDGGRRGSRNQVDSSMDSQGEDEEELFAVQSITDVVSRGIRNKKRLFS